MDDRPRADDNLDQPNSTAIPKRDAVCGEYVENLSILRQPHDESD